MVWAAVVLDDEGSGWVSSGRQGADNNQAWAADRRMQDCRVQSAVRKSWLAGSGLGKTKKAKAATGRGN